MRQYLRDDKNIAHQLWRSNIILFLSLLILIFLVPVIKGGFGLIASLSLATVVLSGVFAGEFEKRIASILFSLACLVIIFLVLDHLFPEIRAIRISAFVLVVISILFSTVALVLHVAISKKADKSTLLAAINAYLLIGLAGSVVLQITDLFFPNSFSSLQTGPGSLADYIYFGFVTMTTLGYGDIAPTGPIARSISTLLALMGQLYLVIIMALIIGKYLGSRPIK